MCTEKIKWAPNKYLVRSNNTFSTQQKKHYITLHSSTSHYIFSLQREGLDLRGEGGLLGKGGGNSSLLY